ncbi:hypothetical protein CCM_05598 [Cordyceps militaris CM01]|uniref:Uncharacterized protein n=1 Tax=Cordyceps militaris (strain CM01) TaxID=983644 RepID=G3JKK1_CORMM|nr:uncharacterized protein CCM_05598 [Cordyceps militaris CM01]EGX91440.1 hypothetical protein CCM_05598 [Cordyceps militaris CM01]
MALAQTHIHTYTQTEHRAGDPPPSIFLAEEPNVNRDNKVSSTAQDNHKRPLSSVAVTEIKKACLVTEIYVWSAILERVPAEMCPTLIDRPTIHRPSW